MSSKKHHSKISFESKDHKTSKHGHLKGGGVTIQDLLKKQLDHYQSFDEKSYYSATSKGSGSRSGGAVFVGDKPISGNKLIGELDKKLANRSEIYKLDDSHIYYNAVMTNTSTTKQQIATFQEFRADPIIDKPEDYHLSVIRFAVPGINIPIFIASIQAGPSPFGSNSNPNKTNYSVTLSYGSDDGTTVPMVNDQEFVIYLSMDFSQPTPTRWDQTGVNLNNQYYSVYSYQAFLDMINNAFGTALANLITAVGAPVGVINPPKFIYNPATQLISLIVEKGYIPPGSVATPYVHVYINSLLATFFDTFNFVLQGDAATLGRNFQFAIENTSNNVYTQTYGPIAAVVTNTATTFTSGALFTKEMTGGIVSGNGIVANTTATFNTTSSMTLSTAATASGTFNYIITNNNYVSMTQESPALFLWNSIRSIVFTTGTIPVKAEYVPNATQGSIADNFIPILTDFEPLQITGNDRSLIQYYPTSEYRLIDLKGNTPLNSFDVQIFWQDKQQNRYPLYLPPLGSADIKFLIRKKNESSK